MTRDNVHTAISQTARTLPRNGGRVPSSSLRQKAWPEVVDVTVKHSILRITVNLATSESWTYIECDCGETFDDNDGFTDHIRRLTFEAIMAVVDA